jgi:hypothetical protein
MKLASGAAGFSLSTGGNQPRVGLSGFLGACHQVARQTDSTVVGTVPAGVTPSFHTVVLSYDDARVAVLCHVGLPVVALAEPLSPGKFALSFVDRGVLADAFTDVAAFRMMTVQELHTPTALVDLSELSGAEHDQINYWKPATLGDLLFNFWQ